MHHIECVKTLGCCAVWPELEASSLRFGRQREGTQGTPPSLTLSTIGESAIDRLCKEGWLVFAVSHDVKVGGQ